MQVSRRARRGVRQSSQRRLRPAETMNIRRLGATFVGIVTLVSFVAGCASGGWTLYVYNNRESPVLVRFGTGGRTTTQQLTADQQGFVFDGKEQPVGATVDFIDPATCQVLATASDLPPKHALIVFGPETNVGVSMDDPGDQARVLLASSASCE
jgi:hypothetical protein